MKQKRLIRTGNVGLGKSEFLRAFQPLPSKCIDTRLPTLTGFLREDQANLVDLSFECEGRLKTKSRPKEELSDKKTQLVAKLNSALKKSWDLSTSCNPSEWSASNLLRGQCAGTSLVVYDYLGGEIVWAVVSGPNTNPTLHYFNEVDGVGIDFTKEQFPIGTSLLRGTTTGGFDTVREFLLSCEATKKRYNILKERVERVMRL